METQTYVSHRWMTNEFIADMQEQDMLAQVCAQFMQDALAYQEGIECTVPPEELEITMSPPLPGTPEAEVHLNSQAVRCRWSRCPVWQS
jgi:limonene-1,2-epoxide hydrolase